MSQLRVRFGCIEWPSVFAVVLLVGLTVGFATTATAAPVDEGNGSVNVTEEAYVESAPEPGDEYFEAEADDGRWVSYVNPRDEYRDPYLGDGSGKICTALFNEAGEPIVGETVPNTTVSVPTGEAIEWHSEADPMTVEYPLTEHYDRPLDADQFGTADDIGQGDGYMDSHCIEFHGPATNETIEYGEASIEGEHADRIEVVGYIQEGGDTWETDVDPIEDATSYEEAGGGWTYSEDASHGQVVVVLQLEGTDATDDDPERNDSNESNKTATTADADNASTESTDDESPGFGAVTAVVAVLSALGAALVGRMR
ncbi:MAG: PGF-CTERM sorting domain-containing protein [Halohasta sp.]